MKWISVKEEIYPQENGAKFLALGFVECLECPDRHVHTLRSIHEATYIHRNWERCVFSETVQKFMFVTHWMKLPELPKD